MILRPAGKTKAGKAYPAFYGCENFRDGCKQTMSTIEYKKQEAQQNADADKPVPAKNVPFILSERKSDKKPVLVQMFEDKFLILSRDQKTQILTREEVIAQVTSLRDANNQTIRGNDALSLFRKYDELKKLEAQQLKPVEQDVVTQPKENIAPKVKNEQQQAVDPTEKDDGVDAPEKPQQAKKSDPKIPADRMSEHQRGIQDSFLDSDSHIMINALAGTGKTTLLRHISSFKKPEGEKWLYLVFNKKNQVEASTGDKSFPNGVEVKTTNSFLGQVLSQTAKLGGIQDTQIVPRGAEKLVQTLDFMMSDDNTTFHRDVKFEAIQVIKKLGGLARSFAIDPRKNDAATAIGNLIDQYGIETDLSLDENGEPKGPAAGIDYRAQIIDKTLDLLHYLLPGNEISRDFRGYRDHNDTLWYATINERIAWPKYDVVLADEVQDFNACQIHMLQKLAEKGARIIAVGDPNQSIYMFRGADSEAFNRVKTTLQNTPRGSAEKSLPVNYRCAPEIIDYVNKNTVVNNLVAGRNIKGKVTDGLPYESELQKLVDEKTATGSLNRQTAFISRTNAPLVKSALFLLSNNIDFVILGTDLSKDLTDFVKKITGTGRFARNIPIGQLDAYIQKYIEEKTNAWSRNISKQDELSEVRKLGEAMIGVIGFLRQNRFEDSKLRMRVNDSRDMIEYVKKKFAGINLDDASAAASLSQKDPRSFVTLTSAHRSKGLEFSRVYIVEPQLFPHPNAKTPAALQQEDHAKYVALTRAINVLHVLAPMPEEKEASVNNNTNIGWYKRAQQLTPEQLQQYFKPQTIGSVKLIGSGLGATFNLPNLGITMRGGDLMNKVLSVMQSELIKENVHTIDTSPVAGSNILGVNRSNEPGVIHVDVPKILALVQKQALPAITQLDGTKIDADAKRAIYEQIASTILHQLADTTAHEAQHEIDYWKSLQTKGRFESSESGAQQAGQSAARRVFPIKQ